MKFAEYVLYLLVMAGVTYLVRAVPFIAIRKKIKNRFVRSFLAYIPYAVLSAMTFPGVFYCTGSIGSALVGTAGAILAAFLGAGLSVVALVGCVLVFVSGFFL